MAASQSFNGWQIVQLAILAKLKQRIQVVLNKITPNKTCTVGQKKKKKHPYLFQYKLSYRNETGTNHHGFLSISVWCFKIFLRSPSTRGSLTNFNFFKINPPIFQRNRWISQIAWKQIFTKFLTLVWEILDVGAIANARI